MLILDNPDAVAAFGTIKMLEGLDASSLSSDPLWANRIIRAVGRGAVDVAINLDELSRPDFSSSQIETLGEAWKQGARDFMAALPNGKLRLQVRPSDAETDDRIAAELRKASHVNSIIFVDRNLNGPDRWGWPLEVRAIGSESKKAVEEYHHQGLVKFDATDASDVSTDLLIIDSLEDFLASPLPGLSTGFLLVMTNNKGNLKVETVRQLNRIIGFRAAAIVEEQVNPQSVIHDFLDELSHNHPPDLSICNAMESGSGHMIVGDPGFLNQSRVTVSTAILEDRLERDFLDGLIDSADFIAMTKEIDSFPQATAHDHWYSESGAATDTAVRSVPVLEELEARESSADQSAERTKRFLQAQVFELTGGGPVQRSMSFEAGASHEIKIRIGATSLNWVNAPRAFPDHQLPQSEARLTVTLHAPVLMAESRSQEIVIGPTGTSTVAGFEVFVPPDIEKLEATIIVYHEGKHLQSGVLSGPVTVGEDSSAVSGIDFAPGLPSSADLDHQQAFDLVIWKNGDELELTLFDPSVASGEPSNISLHPTLGGIKGVVDGIRNELFNAASKMQQLDAGIDTAGLDTIRSLAEQGEFLRRKLFNAATQSLIRRVQVVSPNSGDFFPVEFLYDFVLPDTDAQLCPEFKKSKSPNCSADCYASKGDPGYVCPSGFWSLNRVIERQVRPLDRADSRQPESSGHNPNLQTVASIVFSASDEVNAAYAGEINDTISDMAKVASVHRASTWKEWGELVQGNDSALLVTLPHNVESSPFNKLRISDAEDLPLNRIQPQYVMPAVAQQGPVMLLLGCNTANPAIGYQDFVNEMRSNGAALVIGTLTYVLGPQAARVARELVRQIGSAGNNGLTIGEIMRQVRARMLAEDNIMALAITAFGDADWRFLTEEN
jgi:hypothetical protein